MEKPISKREDVVEIIQGTQVVDSYRWLEDSKGPETQEWIESQNAYTTSVLKGDISEKFSDDLAKNFKVINFSNPIPVNGKYFYTERKPDEDQFALYVTYELEGDSIKLIDPNGMRADNTVSIGFWSVSRSGKYIAYGLSQGGDEMATLYIKDVENNANLKDQISRCRHSQIAWLPDDSGFFYTRNPQPGTVPKNEEHLHVKVYFHIIGNDPSADELIFGKNRPKDDMIGISLSLDGRYLAITVAQTWSANDIYIYDRNTRNILPLVVGIPAKFSLRFLSDKVLVGTNYHANNFHVLSSSFEKLFTPIEKWSELIPEQEHLLQTAVTTRSRIIAAYLVNAYSKVVMFDHNGREIGVLPLPKYSSLAGISRSVFEEEFFYGVDSFLSPKTTYRYSPEDNKFIEYRRTDNPINSDDYISKQEWYISKDGTKIPLFIIHKKDISNSKIHPTILYGYGGFAHLNTPGFLRNFIPWLERGGIYVIANIRGNAEFGEVWHRGGIKENKQNSYDDFIAAAEYLIKTGYTNEKHLGILGGSNGGLLVTTVAVQRPDLFKAVCARVPLTDMVRFPLFGIASRWVHEYGDPQNVDDLRRILTWSPYHNVRHDVEYPPFLFTTAEKDTRVNPLHARKMTALLQSVNKKNPILLFTEIEAGHGHGKPIRKIVEVQAFILTFFAQNLGMKT